MGRLRPHFDPAGSSVPRRSLAGILSMVVILGLGGRGASAQPPARKPAPAIARYIPRQDLVAFWELNGLDAEAEAWHKTAAFKLLNETTLGVLLEDVAGQLLEFYLSASPGARRIPAADYLAMVKRTARDGLAVGVIGKGAENTHVVIALRKGNRPETTRSLEAIAMRPADGADARLEEAQTRGRTLHSLDLQVVWWAEGDDLLISARSAADGVLDVIEGKQPGADGHPLLASAQSSADGFKPVARGFVDLEALPPMSPDAAKLGLDGLKRIEIRWGFQDEALMTSVRVLAPAPRQGLLGYFDQPNFNLRSLPPIPAGQTGFAVLSIDLAKAYDRYVALVKGVGSTTPDGIELMENAFRQQFGMDLRADLLAHLGPRMGLYAPAPATPPDGNALVAMAVPYAGLTLSIQVKDPEALGKRLEGLIGGINQVLAQRPAGQGGGPPQFRKKAGPGTSYTLEYPPGSAPEGPWGLLSPTIALDREQLVISGTAAAAEKALSVVGGPPDRRWAPGNELVRLVEKLPPELLALVVTDPRLTIPVVVENLPTITQAFNAQLAQARGVRGGRGPDFNLQIDPLKLPPAESLRRLLFPASTALTVDDQGIRILQRESIPSLASPSTAGMLAALLMPARMSAREAARRAQCTNNLKQIMLAMHNHLSANDRFPRDYTDKDGKPTLSWRVAILPYVEQAELYNKFKLDEPWDSPHNKALLKEMPQLFRCPDRAKPEPFTTTYRVFVGPGALFESGQDVGLAQVTDGTSNTIAIVESKDAVPWTKPDDIAFDEQAKPSLLGAGSPHPGGFNCGFADGSVRFLKDTVAVQVFKALITRAGGEVVSSDSF